MDLGALDEGLDSLLPDMCPSPFSSMEKARRSDKANALPEYKNVKTFVLSVHLKRVNEKQSQDASRLTQGGLMD